MSESSSDILKNDTLNHSYNNDDDDDDDCIIYSPEKTITYSKKSVSV